MHSVLFDYTGTFRPSPDNQETCPLPIVEEEEHFDTPPTTPTEVPPMNPLVGAVHVQLTSYIVTTYKYHWIHIYGNFLFHGMQVLLSCIVTMLV